MAPCRSIAIAALCCSLLPLSMAQQAGTQKPEVHVPINLWTCTKAGGCTAAQTSITMDAQWRWTHDKKMTNCLTPKDAKWQPADAPDGRTAAANCALEGMTLDKYKTTYGVSTIPGGIKLNFVNGQSIGSRLYMMEDESTYKMFKLLNKEFTFDVDVSTLECGLNGAVYFVEMEANGGLGKGNNTAGAKFGTGYCDAQCPHDLKFVDGEGNVKNWNMTKTGPIGEYGHCCSEMDIWEANAYATAYTTHACSTIGPLKCQGYDSPINQCGDTPKDCECCDKLNLLTECPCCGRYKGVCDKDGCDFNSYRMGDETFFSKGGTVNTQLPMTVVTQFITTDGTDLGDLKEVRRLYVQNGKVIQNSKISAAKIPGAAGQDSITDEVCRASKTAFVNHDDFTRKGSLAGMGAPLKRGMVLVLSLWDDMLTKMKWLDSATPSKDGTRTVADPGVKRGPCAMTAGNPAQIRGQYPTAHTTYTNIMIGELGSTFTPEAQAKKKNPPPVKAPVAAPPVQPQPPVQPVPGQPQQPMQPLQPVAPVAPLPGVAAAAPGQFCCYYSPDQNDYCGKCTSRDASVWMSNPQHCQQANGRVCGGTARLFDAGEGASVAAATGRVQRQLPTVAMVLAWSGTAVMLVAIGAMSFARFRRAGQIPTAVVDSSVGPLIQENPTEEEGATDVA